MMLNKFFFGKKGETLLEVTIALAILALVLVATIRLAGNAKLSIETARDRSQAVSLAREGLEVTRYVRDLNWIKYAKNRRICWNFLADNQAGGTSDGIVDFSSGDADCEESAIGGQEGSANFIFSGAYLPLQNLSDESYSRFFLSTKGQDLDSIWPLKNNGKIYTDLSIFRLCQDGTGGLIVSCESPGINSSYKGIKFFRKIKIEYIDIFGNSQNLGSDPKLANHMKITSTVVWPHANTVLSVELTTILSDYYGRSSREE